MVLDIKMCRFDNVPWGFRLVGGADYEYPLTVVKVMEGSIADEAGLCVEDVIVRINDTAAMPLTHDEAHRLIMSSGSVFYFGVHREQEEEVYEGTKKFPLSSSSLTKSLTPTPGQSPSASASASPLPSLTEATKALIPEQEQEQEQERERFEFVANVEQPLQEMHSDGYDYSMGNGSTVDSLYLPDLPDRPCSAMSAQADIMLVEEEIAAVLSGETEVLKEHNVLGIFPKPGVCMTSDVLRSLNEEVTKTKLEKEKENRKWSTFLQRPDRPVPKSKQQLEAERRAASAYKVKIVKSAPREKSPMPETKPKEATPPPKEDTPPQVVEEVEEEPLPTDSEVPNLEQLPDNGNDNDLPEDAEGEQLEKADASKEEPEEQASEPNEQQQQQELLPEDEQESTPAAAVTPPKTDEELALEKQLCDVQKQLAALSTLPSTIQSTLDAVTKQLAELLPTFKLQQQQQQQQQQDQPQIDEQQQQDEGQQQQPGEYEAAMSSSAAATDKLETEEAVAVATAACENNEDKCDDANDLEVAKISLTNGDNRELDGQLNEEQCFKKQKIAFWNRLFNGEHITRQRFRVNFMKYQKPERKIDLNRSEVYKVIHHLDRAPIRGIEVRAPLVAAESDIRQSLQSS